MKHFKTLQTSVCLAALLAGTTAHADVTAEQVWQDWKETFALYGEDGVTIGSEEISSGTVTVSDLVLSMEEEGTSVKATLGDLVFTERGDGTVAVTMSETYPIEINPEPGDFMRMSLTQTGLEIIVGGTPDELTYDISADRYMLSIDEMTEAGESVMDGDIQVTANDLTGTYTIAKADMRNIDYALATSSLDILIDVAEPGGEGQVVMSGKIDGMTAAAQMAIPLEADFENPDDLFTGGFAVVGGYGFDSANYIFDVDADDEKMAGSITMGSGNVDVEFNADKAAYGVLANDIAMSVQGAEIPFPIDISLAEYGISFDVPLSKSDAPSPFGMSINLTDLAVNDQIWLMADPSGALPHDPATIRLDLTGTAQLFFDLLDPEQAEAVAMAAAPGELNSVQLNDLQIAIAGAEVTGTGDFTFDNTDMQTIPGMPRPEGAVTLNISGANALIDSLVSMGLLPEDQAMMGRMMMGMFARTVGEDELTSTIEVNEQGHVLANGQRIQ